MAFGSNSVRAFCAEARKGMLVTALPSIAEKHGISLRTPGVYDEEQQGWTILVPVTVTMGDLVCVIRHNRETVISVHMEGPGA